MGRIWIAVAFLASASVASAGQSWLALSGGSSSYSLGELVDQSTSYRGFTPEAGTLGAGNMFSAAVGMDLGRQWSAGFVYERCSAGTSATSTNYEAELQLPLSILKVAANLYVLQHGALRVGLGAGMGVAHLAGSIEMTSTSGYRTGGTGDAVAPTFNAALAVELAAMKNITVVASAGARHAKFSAINIGLAPLRRDVDGVAVEPDYSGWFVQLGLKLLLPTSDSGI